MWIHERTKTMYIDRKDIKNYATKSISGKYNSRILEFVKSFTQHFNSKTTNSVEAITIKEIDFQFAIDKNEIIWLLDTQNIRLKIDDRTVPMFVGSKKEEDDVHTKKITKSKKKEEKGYGKIKIGSKKTDEKSPDRKRSKSKKTEEEQPIRKRNNDHLLKNINQLDPKQLSIRNKTDNKHLL